MNQQLRRHLLGILSLILLAIAGYGHFALESTDLDYIWNSCWRIGLVMGAVWLALPQLLKFTTHVSPVMLALIATIGVVVVIRPRTIVVLGPLLLVLALLQFFGWLLKPPPKKPRRE